MIKSISLALAAVLLSASTFAARGEVAVVASIKPVHSLVSVVMEGVSKPGIIVDGGGSPHSFALKPSQARMLQSAQIVFWVGHSLEGFLEKPLETISANAKLVELVEAPGLQRLDVREGGAFEAHEHDADAHGDDHEGDDAFDAHVWLDPANAIAMVDAIQDALGAVDPANAAAYEANAGKLVGRLEQLVVEVTAELEPVRDKGFVVFHDAYQYFENRFGVRAVGSLTVSPEVMPGAERVDEIRARVRDLGVYCVFAEPQFEPRLISTVIEGTGARAGFLDPLGSDLSNGPDLYFELIRNMGKSIRSCLSGDS
ncbi:MAG: zinc ABC transporter substrate-binding protein [Rhizobiaceae bacterium]